MPKQIRAIALCRVSSNEQLENNSLNRQRDAVLKAAKELNVEIPPKYWWSGSVSSKRGTNVKRKDLKEMEECCKKDKNIKYVIVDEPDRFMRSIQESSYFEVRFQELGVQVWYASDPELNKDNMTARLLKFTRYLSAESSNEERQRKSISGQTKALMEGRYPFSPKPGYMRSSDNRNRAGIQEIHPTRGPALKKALVRIANRQATPTQALIELNKSSFTNGHAPYKMDKFRKIIADPFYAGIVEIHKEIDVRNENGLHEPLITKEQHRVLLKIMDNKAKNQSGPRKNGNPKFPLNNITHCDLCTDAPNGRYVGFNHGNGHSKLRWDKYRCRACNRYRFRADLHTQVEQCFARNLVTKHGLERFKAALATVWKQEEAQTAQEVLRTKHKIKTLSEAIEAQVDAVTDPAHASIKDNLLASIAKKEAEVTELEDSLANLAKQVEANWDGFLDFAFNFAEDMGNRFLEIPQEDRLRCKQIVFPAGFHIDADGKVYTPEISPLITLAANKKDAEAPLNSHLVRVPGL